jgi:hypothetical protein
MRLLNKHSLRTPLLVVAMSGALVASSAFAQSAGTSTPSPTQPSIGVGTAAPPSPSSAASTGVGTTPPPSPVGTNSNVLTSPSGLGTSTNTIGTVPNKSELTSSAFDMLDTSKRGFVTRDDVAKLPGFDSAFQQADENNDGRLSESEFARAWIAYSRQP